MLWARKQELPGAAAHPVAHHDADQLQQGRPPRHRVQVLARGQQAGRGARRRAPARLPGLEPAGQVHVGGLVDLLGGRGLEQRKARGRTTTDVGARARRCEPTACTCAATTSPQYASRCSSRQAPRPARLEHGGRQIQQPAGYDLWPRAERRRQRANPRGPGRRVADCPRLTRDARDQKQDAAQGEERLRRGEEVGCARCKYALALVAAGEARGSGGVGGGGRGRLTATHHPGFSWCFQLRLPSQVTGGCGVGTSYG